MARPLSALPLLILAAGCAPKGDYPSLAPRPIEKALAEADIERPEQVLPRTPEVEARAGELGREVAAGRSEFEAALPAARSAVGAAGAAGSESWIEAQQALSRLEAARAATTRALAELDRYSSEQAASRRLSPADIDLLRETLASAQAVADRQQDEVDALRRRLRSF
jgi:hypothetical protein